MTRALVGLLLCFGVGSAGCPSPVDETCAQRLEPLRRKVAQLRALARQPDYFGANASVAPTATSYRLTERPGALVQLNEGRLRLDGRDLGPVASSDTAHSLQRDLLMRQAWLKSQPVNDQRGANTIYVIARPDRSLKELSWLANVVAEQDELRLVVRGPEPLPNPVPARASEELRQRLASIVALPPADRTVPLGALAGEGVGGCSSARALYEQIRLAEPSSRAQTLMDGIVPALEGCDCRGADVDKMEASTVLILQPSGPASGWLPLDPQRLREADAADVTGRRITVGDLVAQLVRTEAGARPSR